jgi:hypothetical protein
MFGRAGRPQFDKEGHVFALAHEDDVKLAKWKVKYDSIPEDTKDPNLMKAKKALLKKKPSRRTGFTYWNAEQFAKLQTAPPARLGSKGRLSWRWLGYLLEADPAVAPIRQVIEQRLMDQPSIEAEIKRLTKMLVTLSHMGVFVLDPPPPASWLAAVKPGAAVVAAPVEEEESAEEEEPVAHVKPPTVEVLMARLKLGEHVGATALAAKAAAARGGEKAAPPGPEPYHVMTATPTAKLKQIMIFKAVHTLYGLFLMD